MPYIVIVITPYIINDPDQFREYPTEEEADAAARNIVTANPSAMVMTAQAIKRYKADIIVNAEESWPKQDPVTPTT